MLLNDTKVVMRGENGEAIVGGGRELVNDELMISTSREMKGSPSPPLSAAVSQVSLAPSDLTTSDPDLAASSAYSSGSSRPPSSQLSLAATDLDLIADVCSRPPSSGIDTPDLALPAPEDYTTETVEFPTSPLALKTGRERCNGVCFVESDEVIGDVHPGRQNFLTPSYVSERPVNLEFGTPNHRKRISVADDILCSPVEDDTISVASSFSQRSNGEQEDDIEEEDLEGSEPAEMKYNMDHEPLPPPPPQLIPEFSAAEETAEERHWRSVVIGGVWRKIDMKVIAPYRKCISHGGYLGENQNAVIVICACQLPDRSRRDYNYVMDNLFLYVLSTLEQLIADDYILVYLAGGTPSSTMPSFHWLKRAYQMIDRKLRKNLKALHVVHPTFWVRAMVTFSRPFISSKFYRKLSFVENLTQLAQMVPLDQLNIPDAVKQADFDMMIREKKSNLSKRRAYSMTVR
ncbi:hypothetical protein OTU49_003510 [Cherax quadricarinatus]|uniref:CRAL-TRIO domain-containing protein n=1 Tax=Cherax quadricarinatus TaxID=27406 RepID=A0AAW0XFM2_CHEQU